MRVTLVKMRPIHALWNVQNGKYRIQIIYIYHNEYPVSYIIVTPIYLLQSLSTQLTQLTLIISFISALYTLFICVISGPGLYADVEGLGNCKSCPLGTQSISNDAADDSGSTGCDACLPGSYAGTAGTRKCL